MSLKLRLGEWVFAATVIALAGCGGSVTPEGGGGSGGTSQGGSGDGGASQGGSGGEGGSASGCPATEPADGQACTPLGIVCEYDDGIVLECRPHTTCTASGWETLAPNCISDPPPDPLCPGTQPNGNCIVDADPSLCVYGATICGCSNCLGGPCGGQAQWVCAEAPSAPCPASAPLLGSACANEGVSCSYGSCALAVLGGRRCEGGIWVDEDIACPL